MVALLLWVVELIQFMKVQIYKRKDGEWGWRVRGNNNEIRIPPEGHFRKADALRAMTDVFNDIAHMVRTGQKIEVEYITEVPGG